MRLFLACALLGSWLMIRTLPAAPSEDARAERLRTLTETRNFSLGRPVHAQPTEDGAAVLFLRALGPRDPRLALCEFQVASGQTIELLRPDAPQLGEARELSLEEKARRERSRTAVGGFTTFLLSPGGADVLVPWANRLFLLHRADRKVRELQAGEGSPIDPQFSPDGSAIAYVRGADLYVYDLQTNRERAVTTGGTETLTHGLAEFVAQEEMGRDHGFWWTGDGRALVYQSNDASGVEVWNVADPAAGPETPPYASRYPRPGRANVEVRLYRQALDGGEPREIRWDRARYPYLTHVGAAPGAPLTVTVQSRDQRDLVLYRVDPEAGETAPLLEERDALWVNLVGEMPRFLPDGRFLWASEAAGAWRLELRSADGTLERVLVAPDRSYASLAAVRGETVFFQTAPEPGKEELWSVRLDGTRLEPLLADQDGHRATFARSSGDVFVDERVTTEAMPSVSVRTRHGGTRGVLPSLAETPVELPRLEYATVGDEAFRAVVIRPSDFRPGRKYPVIVDVYGGPGVIRVVRDAAAYLWDGWRADGGYVVVAIDGRGTPGRGRDWERAIAGKFGEVPLSDQVTALRALGARFPELDLDRVGVCGWSFGGYLSACAALRRPDVFKAAVAGAPVTDWSDYDTHYTERYLGLPGEAVYRHASLLEDAPRLRRPLLLVHGTADDNVYFRHSLKLADRLVRSGRPFAFLPLPGSTHQLTDPALRAEVERRTLQFFDENL